jgi:putative transferase (TIGR04331 family)
VLPYHWDDRDKLYRDSQYLGELYERNLHRLADVLNAVHGKDHSLRYWRIVVGPWLYQFTSILFDSYECIVSAERSGRAELTLVGETEPSRMVLRDCWDLASCFGRDDYRQYLFGQVLQWRRNIPFEKCEVSFDIAEITRARGSRVKSARRAKEKAVRVLQTLSRLVPDSRNRLVFIEPALAVSDQIRLQLSLRQFPYVFVPVVKSPMPAIDWPTRGRIALSDPRNDFEQFLAATVPKQIPSVYIEGHQEMANRARRHYPRNPHLVFTAVSYETNEGFKFWAAEQAEKGCPLVGTLHGFLVAPRWSQEEEHQARIYDRFYTWGGRSDRHANTQPLPAAKLNRAINSLRPKRDGRILFIQHVWPRYAYKMYAVPVAATGTLTYLSDHYELFARLSPSARKLLLVRPFINDRDWSQVARLKERFADVECQSGVPMYEAINESRLIVTTATGTPAAEGLAADFPTILTWNPRQFELRPAAEPFFEELKRAGILCDTPESAAARINEIADDPLSWWRGAEVQQAKNRFCAEFARVSDNWLREWKAELTQVARTARQSIAETLPRVSVEEDRAR